MAHITIVADDLTGAADTSAIMAEAGACALMLADPLKELADHGAEGADVLSLNMFSRCLPGPKAKELHRDIGARIRDFPNQLLVKKMDIAFRGNAAFEIDGLMESMGLELCFVMDAVAALSTFTLYGDQYAMGQRLDMSVYAKEDPIKAPKSANIPKILAESSCLDIASIDIDAVKSDDLPGAVARSVASGKRLLVFDAVSEADEFKIVSQLAPLYPRALWAGSLGLINAIARYSFPGGEGDAYRPRDVRCVGFSASAYSATRRQLERAERYGLRLFALDMDRVAEGERGVAEECAAQALDAVKSGSVFVVPRLSPEHDSPEMARLILETVSQCAQFLCAKAEFQRLVIVGGETAASVMDRLGINKVLINEKTETGIGTGTIVSGSYSGKEISLKGGSVGSELAISKMLCYNCCEE